MTARLFNNNFKFHHKNSSSPSICIYAKNIYNLTDDKKDDNKTYIENPEEIQKIINTLEYQDNDFRFFFKIWIDIDNNSINCDDFDVQDKWNKIFNFWNQLYYKLQLQALKYENGIYRVLQNVKKTTVYTLTPLLSDSNKIKLKKLSLLLGIDESEYNLFVYIFYKWLLNPEIPNSNFNYEDVGDNLSYVDKKLIECIENNLTFSYIMTPVIPKTQTFGDIMHIISKSTVSFNLLMKDFCDIFVNIVKGINNLKNNKISHNDLHENNIFVSYLPNNGGINTFIYDYDRSYYEGFPNPVLNIDICIPPCKQSQCNRRDDWLDFFKILHYVFKYTTLEFNLLLLYIITDTNINNQMSKQLLPMFLEFIHLINMNQFLTYGSNYEGCSWYWDITNQNTVYIRDGIKSLLVNYEEVIKRLENSKNYFNPSPHSFGILNKNNILLNNKGTKFEDALKNTENRRV